jgi:hypothetical protein
LLDWYLNQGVRGSLDSHARELELAERVFHAEGFGRRFR